MEINEKILVAGGSGFVGRNLVENLANSGFSVLSTHHTRDPSFIHPNVEHIYCDLTKPEDCKKVVSGVKYVFMCAANTSGAAVMEKTPLVHVTPNIMMNTLMLEAAYEAKVKKFLFLSSTTIYPFADHPFTEEEPVGDFFEKYFCVGSMKAFSETLCRMYSTKIKNPMTTIIVRPGNLYGEHDDYEWDTSHSTAALIRRVIERHDPIEVWGDGSDIKDILHISDFIDGLIAAMEKTDKFEIFNIASGHSVSIKETLETILDVDNYNDAEIVFDKSKPVMIPKRLINIDKARSSTYLSYSPKTSLREGIKRTIKWYRDERM